MGTFTSWVCDMMGLPATITTETFTPSLAVYRQHPALLTPSQTFTPYFTAVWGSLGTDPVPKGADPKNFGRVFTPDHRMQLELWDSKGIANSFETALVVTVQNKTYYIPAGVANPPVYTNANQVLSVFTSLGWAVGAGKGVVQAKLPQLYVYTHDKGLQNY